MKDRTRKIIVAVLLVIAVCCAGYLIWYYATAAKTKQSYDDAKKLSTENVKPSKTNSDDGEQTKPEIPVDFTALQEKNPDIYAWIKIDGTTVDYPVCQNNEDDNYYLSHTWERVEAADGAIFTQACNSKNFTDFNTVIYGHQMGEGVDTMFHTLDRYLEEGYIEKYPNVIIYTPDHVLTYRIFAAVIYDDRHLINSFNYVMDDQRQAFLDSLQDSRDLRSRYSDIESVGTEDRILSLSTCVTGENPLGYFPFICEIDDLKEADDPDAWHKANPSLEFLPILANRIMHDYLEQKKIPSKRAEFLTKRMNLPARREEETVTTWQNVLRACYEGETMKELERKIPRITLDTRGQAAVIGIDYADVRDFASAGVLTKTDDGEWIWRQHTWICADSPFIDSIKFPLRNAGQAEFEDFEVVPGPVIDVNLVVDWCMEQMRIFDIKKIAMDTYRYTLFKQAFEERGISIEDKKNPHGIVRLIRKISSATGIIAPFIQSMFSQGLINFGQSAIMRWYTNNTSVTEDKFGNKSFGKIEPKLRKNDGFMAFDVAMFCKDELEVQIIYV